MLYFVKGMLDDAKAKKLAVVKPDISNDSDK